MRKVAWITAIVICVSVFLAGCGTKDAAGVVKELEQKAKKLESYQGSGTMTLHTGEQPQEYKVEVWYQEPYYYRISLTNEKKDISQIVLRNDDGVFVLTPHLNKSFRFQSNWPENQGQVYLYQTLIQSILMDNERQFVKDKDNYLFDVVANYQNGSLARQKIWLNKDYAPQQVQVSDSNANVMVEVKFDQFEFGKKFEKDSFEMQRNMQAWKIESLPTMAELDENGNIIEQPVAPMIKKNEGDFGILEPSYLPEGVTKKDESDIKLGENKAVMLRYSGEYNFTLIEARSKDEAVSLVPGEIVDLGFTVAHLTGEEMQTLTWNYEGVEFRLSSGNLPPTEMIQVAQSVQGQIGK